MSRDLRACQRHLHCGPTGSAVLNDLRKSHLHAMPTANRDLRFARCGTPFVTWKSLQTCCTSRGPPRCIRRSHESSKLPASNADSIHRRRRDDLCVRESGKELGKCALPFTWPLGFAGTQWHQMALEDYTDLEPPRCALPLHPQYNIRRIRAQLQPRTFALKFFGIDECIAYMIHLSPRKRTGWKSILDRLGEICRTTDFTVRTSKALLETGKTRRQRERWRHDAIIES